MIKPMLDLFSGKTPATPPVWIMRQAGRYLPEYHTVRSKYSFLELCKTPEAATEVTLQPIDIFDMDAAIIFSDILVIPEAMGMGLQFLEGKGPVFSSPVRTKKDIENLNQDVAENVSYVYDVIKLVRKELREDKTLIGFAGAPFTLACYMVEGAASKNYIHIKSLMYKNEIAFRQLMEKVTHALITYFDNQVKSGAEVLMLFDTFGGIVSPYDYQRYIFEYVKTIFESIKAKHPHTPLIYFVKNGVNVYHFLKELPIDGMGVDWTVSFDTAIEKTENKFILQGNLDPVMLFGSQEVIKREALRIIEEGKKARGHIFNLGHGILPKTPIENVKYLLEVIRCKN